MTQSEKIARIQLALAKGIGPKTFLEILDKYKSAKSYWKCPSNNPALSNSRVKRVLDKRPIVYGEKTYPKLLAQINDPPPYFFYKGNLDILKGSLLSIVGTRNHSTYAANAIKEIISKLPKHTVVVSGMAFGIDALAHKYAMEFGLKTIAVLPSPLEKPYPRTHQNLFKEIIEDGGLVVSEYLLEQDMNKHNFVRRNRIIAGLSSTTIIIEAPKKSGALITAHMAFNYNRRVLSVPSPYGLKSGVGGNDLVAKNIAELFVKPDQLGVLCGSSYNQGTSRVSKLQEKILQELTTGNLSETDLLIRLKLSPDRLITTLVELETQNLVARDLIGNYTLVV